MTIPRGIAETGGNAISTNTNTCTLCGQTATNGASFADYPYCEFCHYSGAAYSDIWKDTIFALAEAGFFATVWQTGGGCMNLAVALTEGGFHGPVAMMGNMGMDIASTEAGCCILAHGDSDPEECYGYEDDCPACAAIAPVADKANTEVRDDFTIGEYNEWVVATSKALAKVIAANTVHAS